MNNPTTKNSSVEIIIALNNTHGLLNASSGIILQTTLLRIDGLSLIKYTENTLGAKKCIYFICLLLNPFIRANNKTQPADTIIKKANHI